MSKKCIAMRKRFKAEGVLYEQDCLTGLIAAQEEITATVESTPETEHGIEIPQFFLAWQERRDSLAKAFRNID